MRTGTNTSNGRAPPAAQQKIRKKMQGPAAPGRHKSKWWQMTATKGSVFSCFVDTKKRSTLSGLAPDSGKHTPIMTQYKWPIGKPRVDHLRGPLWEVCDKIGTVLPAGCSAVAQSEMILLRAFINKTQQTNPADIEVATKRLKECKNRRRNAQRQVQLAERWRSA